MVRARQSPSAPDYGYDHRRARKAWQAEVDSGQVACSRCGYLIHEGMAWDLDHADDPSLGYLGPAHMTCNRSAGATKGNKGRGGPTPERDW